jgi:hypothetical protein
VAGAEVLHVERRRPDPRLLGAYLDRPAEGPLPGYAVPVAGWALGPEGPPEAVRALAVGQELARAPVSRPRRDIAGLHPRVPGAGACGFRLEIDALRLPRTFAVQIVAETGGRSVPLGTVEGTRPALPAAPSGTLQPVLLTSHGRSGSTWLMRLARHHPRLVGYRPFKFEPRVLGYWTSVLTALARPESYGTILGAELSERWWLGDGAAVADLDAADPAIAAELGRHAVDDLARLALRRVEAFYRAAAGLTGEPDPRFFVEKWSPGEPLHALVAELYPGAREIVLVRDPRDMACSMLAWDARRGSDAFGRGDGMGDAFLERVAVAGRDLAGHLRRSPLRPHLVRYEELVRAPEATLTALFADLGVEADEATVAAIMEAAAAGAEERRAHRTTESAERSIGRWERDLPPDLQRRSAELFAPVLSAFGYAA